MAENLERILDNIDALIYVSDIETGEILFINKKAEQEFGVVDAKGQICWKVLQKGMTEVCGFCPVYRLQLIEEEPITWEEHNTLTGRFYQNTDRLIPWIDGRMVHIQHSVDITEQKEFQHKLERMNEQQRIMGIRRQAMLDACPLGCHFRNSSYELIDCNSASLKLFGYDSQEEYLDKGVKNIFSRLKPEEKLSADEIRNYFDKVREEGRLRKELIIEDKAGNGIPCEVTMVKLETEDDFVIVSYIRDLREIEEKEERIKETKFDELTGIYSKRYFMEEAGRLLEYCCKQEVMFSVILFSIDRLKRINGEFGHAVGDDVILRISEIMRKKLDINHVYGRFDGTGFLIGLTGYDTSGTWKLAEEIREEVAAASYREANGPVQTTISTGIAIRRDEKIKLTELLEQADKAMYDARKAGRNCTRIYDKETNAGVQFYEKQ